MRIVETWNGREWVINKGMLPLGQYVIRVRDSNARLPERSVPRREGTTETRQPTLLQIVRRDGSHTR